ncbi:MAG: KGK domain-containing protein [Calothrix sp. MO_192.B10]|nr:KGK domain-containing protein [Calothrix sp. MO_192.B10]
MHFNVLGLLAFKFISRWVVGLNEIAANSPLKHTHMNNMNADNKKLKPIECNDNDVVCFGENIFKIDKLITAVRKLCNQELVNQLYNLLSSRQIDVEARSYEKWFHKGIDCEILTLGANHWRKGKMKFKLSVEFYVEEEEDNTSSETTAESPLDDIRRKISEATS